LKEFRRTGVERNLAGLFARARDVLLTPFQEQVKAQGLALIDWRALKALLAEDGLRIGDIAERALSHQVTVTQAIRRMERAGLVRRRVPSNDRRSRRVYLTRHGRRAASRLLALERRHERAAKRALGGTASRRLETVLLRFVRLIEGGAPRRGEPRLPRAMGAK
jgi:MarR family transcriptional regulator for hemolysin